MGSVETFETIAPAYVGDARIETFLELAATLLDPESWGAAYGLAACYLAAHLITMADASEADGPGGSSGGPVASRKAGDVAIGYSVNASDSGGDEWLSESSFGRAFLGIRKTRAAGRIRYVRGTY